MFRYRHDCIACKIYVYSLYRDGTVGFNHACNCLRRARMRGTPASLVPVVENKDTCKQERWEVVAALRVPNKTQGQPCVDVDQFHGDVYGLFLHILWF